MSTGRGNRGASYMDTYDSNYESGQYDKGGADDKEMTTCTKCTKHCLFIVNFVMLLVGVALIVVAVFAKENADDASIGFGTIDDSMVYLAIASGVLVVIVSFLGCVGATTHSKCILVVFIILLVLSLLMEIVAAALVFTASDDLKSFAKDQWDSLSASEQANFESDNNCCGFETGDCTSDPTAEGCYNTIEQSLQDNLLIIGWVCIAVGVYQFAMAIFACLLCTRLDKTNDVAAV
eukprot:225146_1